MRNEEEEESENEDVEEEGSDDYSGNVEEGSNYWEGKCTNVSVKPLENMVNNFC